MNLQFTLASRYLRGRKLRTTLTTLAVMFGVLVIFTMNLLVPTMIKAFQANMLAASDQVDMTISFRTGESFAPAALDQVTAVDGVRAAHGFLGRPLNLPVRLLRPRSQESRPGEHDIADRPGCKQRSDRAQLYARGRTGALPHAGRYHTLR